MANLKVIYVSYFNHQGLQIGILFDIWPIWTLLKKLQETRTFGWPLRGVFSAVFWKEERTLPKMGGTLDGRT